MCFQKGTRKSKDVASNINKTSMSKTAALLQQQKQKPTVDDTVEEKTQRDADQRRIKQVFAQMNTDVNAAVMAKVLEEERAKDKKLIRTELAVGDIGFSYKRGSTEGNIEDDTILERRKTAKSKEKDLGKKAKKSYKYDRSHSSSLSAAADDNQYHLIFSRNEDMEEPTAQKYMHLYRDMEYMTHEMIYSINVKDIPKVTVDRRIVLDPYGPMDQLECPVFTWDHLKCNTLTTQVRTMPTPKEKEDEKEERTAQETGMETTGEIRVRWQNPVVKKLQPSWADDERTAEMPSECATGRE